MPKVKKKGKSTSARCRNCKFEMKYPRRFVSSSDDYFYCGRLQRRLTLWENIYNIFKPTYLSGIEADESIKDLILDWIFNDAEFNTFGKDIGKIVVDCPGFENKE